MIIFVFIAFTTIAIIQLPSLIAQKFWREVIVFMLFLSLGLGLSILLVSGVKAPYITELIEDLVKKTFHLPS